MASQSAKRKQLTLALAVVLGCLVGAIVWLETDKQATPTQAVEDIQRITITRKGHDDIALLRSNNNWLLSAPFNLDANEQRIEPLLTLAGSDLNGYDKTEVDLLGTGLDDPGASISFEARTFLLGKTDIGGERRYALVDDDVALLPEWVWSLIHGGVSAFADLSVFAGEPLPNTLYLIGEGKQLTLEDISQWQDLQADGISSWPRNTDDNSAPLANWRLSSTEELSEQSELAEITQFEKATFIRTATGFAYAISNARMDALLGR